MEDFQIGDLIQINDFESSKNGYKAKVIGVHESKTQYLVQLLGDNSGGSYNIKPTQMKKIELDSGYKKWITTFDPTSMPPLVDDEPEQKKLESPGVSVTADPCNYTPPLKSVVEVEHLAYSTGYKDGYAHGYHQALTHVQALFVKHGITKDDNNANKT